MDNRLADLIEKNMQVLHQTGQAGKYYCYLFGFISWFTDPRNHSN
jgi:hypothetical protein